MNNIQKEKLVPGLFIKMGRKLISPLLFAQLSWPQVTLSESSSSKTYITGKGIPTIALEECFKEESCRILIFYSSCYNRLRLVMTLKQLEGLISQEKVAKRDPVMFLADSNELKKQDIVGPISINKYRQVMKIQ